MTIKSFILAVTIIGLTNLSETYAMPVTIDFESLTQRNTLINTSGGSYSEDGFTVIGQALRYFGTLERRFTGSTALFNNSLGILELTRTNGNPFDLTSIDLAELNGDDIDTVMFTGTVSGGSTVNQSFTLDGSAFSAESFTFPASFSNLTSVRWMQDNPGHQFDNIVVNGDMPAVPAPSTMLLFGSGIAGLIGWQYRKKQPK